MFDRILNASVSSEAKWTTCTDSPSNDYKRGNKYSRKDLPQNISQWLYSGLYSKTSTGYLVGRGWLMVLRNTQQDTLRSCFLYQPLKIIVPIFPVFVEFSSAFIKRLNLILTVFVWYRCILKAKSVSSLSCLTWV